MNRQTVARLALVGLVLLVLAVAYKTGVLAQFSELSRARQTLLGLGGWGYVAFIVAYAVL